MSRSRGNKQGACSTSADWQIAGSNWRRQTVGAFIQQNFRGDGKNALPGTLRKSEFCSTPKEAGQASRTWGGLLPGETLWAGRFVFRP